jgi:hypothetical protein
MKPLARGIALLLLTGLAAAQPPPVSEEQAERRLAAVGTLLERSSASRQIESSGDARALGRRDDAREVYRRALQARDARNYAEAARLASESSRLMFEAARLAGRDKVTADQQRAGFDAQMQAVRSLLAAQQRISAERPSAQAAEATRSIESLMREAGEWSAANQPVNAGLALKKAYLAAKASVSSMRRGDTLVRSLNFATPDEEYRYELDRNDTHLMLIKTVAADRPSVAGGTGGMLKTSSDKAAELRGRAEKAAGTGDYAAAIALLEDSTRELVRAIRGLGIFIPG